MNKEIKEACIFIKGRCDYKSQRGGFGIIIEDESGEIELSEGWLETTNNRMEFLAAIVGLESLKEPHRVTIYSNLKYLTDSIENGTLNKWEKNNWHLSKNKEVSNPELCSRLLTAIRKHDVKATHIHNDRNIAEISKCSQLAFRASNQTHLEKDIRHKPKTTIQPKASKGSGKKKKSSDKEGAPCGDCGTALVRKFSKEKKRKSRQKYYYEWYLYCEKCKKQVFVEEGKRKIEK